MNKFKNLIVKFQMASSILFVVIFAIYQKLNVVREDSNYYHYNYFDSNDFIYFIVVVITMITVFYLARKILKMQKDEHCKQVLENNIIDNQTVNRNNIITFTGNFIITLCTIIYTLVFLYIVLIYIDGSSEEAAILLFTAFALILMVYTSLQLLLGFGIINKEKWAFDTALVVNGLIFIPAIILFYLSLVSMLETINDIISTFDFRNFDLILFYFSLTASVTTISILSIIAFIKNYQLHKDWYQKKKSKQLENNINISKG